MTIQRMDNVGIVVDDLKTAIAFFVKLGLELEGEATVEGRWLDRIVGLDGVRSDIAMLRTPNGERPAWADQVPHAAGHDRRAERTGEHAGYPSHHVRRRPHRGRPCPPAGPRRRARRRGGAVRGQIPALLRPRPRGHHRRTGRAAQLKPSWMVIERRMPGVLEWSTETLR